MILAHKIALEPNEQQAAYFDRASGVARFAWNWARARWRQEYALWREYRCGPKPTEASLRRELNALKDTAYPWMREVTKNAPQQAVKNLGAAFQNFLEGRARYPNVKKKGRCRASFRADNGTDKQHPNAVQVDGKRIRLPVIGWVKIRERVRFVGTIKSVTVSRVADRWFASVSVEVNHVVPVRENQASVGVDLGVKALATLSDGSVYPGPQALSRNLKRLRRLSRQLCRKVRGSANRKKAAAKLARLHARIANVRQDALHKLTSGICSRFTAVGIEDLNVRGMMANHRVARVVSDVGMFEFRRQLDYKAKMRGCHVAVADRWFPSSKRCFDCGFVHAALTLKDRDWKCPACGVLHDRDYNASLNLRSVADSSLAAASLPVSAGGSVTVCGAEGSGIQLALDVKPAVARQTSEHEIFDHV